MLTGNVTKKGKTHHLLQTRRQDEWKNSFPHTEGKQVNKRMHGSQLQASDKRETGTQFTAKHAKENLVNISCYA